MTTQLKFSIVTPAYNSEKFIRETIESVISQAGEFSIEYIIQDGGSTDGTREIVHHYQRMLSEDTYPIQCAGVSIHWNSGNDDGMYDAINKGFGMATGDIYAYINSDDVYLPGAFNTMAIVFDRFSEIEWLKGISLFMNSNSTIWAADQCHLYAQEWIARGVYGRWLPFINQESVFWRKSLWDKGNGIDKTMKLAGDYSLWAMFARYAPLVSVKAYVSCFRFVEGQLSGNMSEYRKEMDIVCPPDNRLRRTIRLEILIRKISNIIKKIPVWRRIYRLYVVTLIDKKKYRVVKISTNTDIQFYEGNHYFIQSKL